MLDGDMLWRKGKPGREIRRTAEQRWRLAYTVVRRGFNKRGALGSRPQIFEGGYTKGGNSKQRGGNKPGMSEGPCG